MCHLFFICSSPRAHKPLHAHSHPAHSFIFVLSRFVDRPHGSRSKKLLSILLLCCASIAQMTHAPLSTLSSFDIVSVSSPLSHSLLNFLFCNDSTHLIQLVTRLMSNIDSSIAHSSLHFSLTNQHLLVHGAAITQRNLNTQSREPFIPFLDGPLSFCCSFISACCFNFLCSLHCVMIRVSDSIQPRGYRCLNRSAADSDRAAVKRIRINS